MMCKETLDLLTHEIISAAIEVHSILGPGLFEETYQSALKAELTLRGHKAECEVSIPAFYKGIPLDHSYRADIVVDDTVILELKSTDFDSPVFFKQLLTYLRIADKRVGLLINFNKPKLIDGVKRVVNNY